MSQCVNADQLLEMIVNLTAQFLHKIGFPKPKQVRGKPGRIRGAFIRADVDDCLIDRGLVTLQVLEDFLLWVLMKHVQTQLTEEFLQDFERAKQTDAFLRFRSFRVNVLSGDAIVPWSPIELWDTLFHPWPDDLPRTVPHPEIIYWLGKLIQPGKDLRSAWFDFWRNRFFIDNVEKARSVKDAPLFYRRVVRESGLGFSTLTARAESMSIEGHGGMDLRPSTLEELNRHQFPLGPLYMKPMRWKETELEFKKRHFDTHGVWSGSFPLVYIDDKPEVVNSYINSMERQEADAFLGVLFQGSYRSTVELDPRAVVLRGYTFKA